MTRCAVVLVLAACLLAPQAAHAQWKIGGETISRQDIERAKTLWVVGSEVFNPDEIPDISRALRQTYGVVDDERLGSHLNGIVSRLQSSWHEAPVPVRVFVTPDPAYRAFATGDGGIVIAAGMLNSMESEDEVAALLAHEYAHLLLGHDASSVLQMISRKFSGAAEVYLGMRHGEFQGDPSTALVRDLMARQVVAESVQTGLAPARSRRDENSADALAVDLLVAAGYNPVGMVTMLERMQVWEAREQERKEENEHRQATLQAVVTAHATSTKIGGSSQDSRNKLIATGIEGAFGAIGRGIKRLRRAHDTAEKRVDNVLDHLDSAHPDHERPALAPLPWAGDTRVASLLAAVEEVDQLARTLEQNDAAHAAPLAERVRLGPASSTAYARQLLLHALRSPAREWDAVAMRELQQPDSLFQTHFMVLDRLADRRSQNAVEALEISRQSLDNSDELLPYSIRIHRRSGNREHVDQDALRCRATGKEGLQQMCQMAMP